MAGIRIEGTEAEIEEVIKRLSQVLEIGNVCEKDYPSRTRPDEKYRYLRCYTSKRNTILDQLEATVNEVNELSQQLAELSAQNDLLKERLKHLESEPKPRPYDAVLGTSHRL